MRSIFSAAAAAVMAFAVSGCVTVSESDYKEARSYIAGRPALKREIIDDCIAERRAESLGERSTNAALMNVSVANYPQAFCRRVINAYVSGRLTYRDVQNASSSTADNSKFLRIIMGR